MSTSTSFTYSNPEAELLVHCARLEIDSNRAKRIQALVGPDLNWTRLFQMAQRHALIPLLYFQLNKFGRDQVPADRLKELRERFQSNSALNVLLTGEMLRVLALFEQHGIPAVPYKGPALGVGVYGNSSLRQFVDLDILVPESTVWKATDLLLDQGYLAHFVIPTQKQSAFLRLSYVRQFKRNSDGTILELHWRLAPRFFGAPFETSQLWQRTRMIQLQGANVRSPRSEDLVLMLCIHGAKDCWEKLEWVSSLAELIRADRQIDWGKLRQRAGELRCLRIVALGLLLARDILNAPVPADHLLEFGPRKHLDLIAHDIVARFFSDDSSPLTLRQRIKFHLQLKDSWGEKLRYCTRLALTTTPVDWEMMSLPKPASFLYFPLRMLRLFRKYGWESDQLTARNRSVGPV